MTLPDGREDLIQVRRDTAADWASVNPVLAFGEPGWDGTNQILKIGDGVTAWNSLPEHAPVSDSFESTFNLSGMTSVPQHTVRNTTALTVDRLHLFPWRVRRAVNYVDLGAELTTFLAGSTLRVGFYASSPTTRLPTTVLFEDTMPGTGSTAGGVGTNGFVHKAINWTLTPGLYYLAAVQQGTAATWRVIQNPPISLPIVPHATTLGANFIGAAPAAVGYRGTAAVAGALQPNPAFTTLMVTLFPLIGLIAA